MERATDMLRFSGNISPGRAINVYRSNISGALTRALENAYPACRRILGQACFRAVAQRFAAQTPSVRPDLNGYGDNFGSFLDQWTCDRDGWDDFIYLGDLARLEWLRHRVWYKKDDRQFDFSAFAEASLRPENHIRLQLSHSIGLLQSGYPVLEILEANLSKQHAREVNAGELPERLVVYRLNGLPRIARVDPATFDVLIACRDGMTLRQLTDAVLPLKQCALTCLPGLIRNTWITGFTVERKPGLEDYSA